MKPEKFFGEYAYDADESSVHVTDCEPSIVDCLDSSDLTTALIGVDT